MYSNSTWNPKKCLYFYTSCQFQVWQNQHTLPGYSTSGSVILIPVSIFPCCCRNTTSLPNNCRITYTPLVSIFWILKMELSFVANMIASNHLVIVNYFTGAFSSVTAASNHEQGSLEQVVWNFCHGFSYSIYLCITLEAIVI